MAPSSLLFFMTLLSGTAVALSSSNWLYLWMGMELNLISFIPLMSSSNSFQETEASVKYFIIQAIGSGLMLTAGIASLNPSTAAKYSVIVSLMFILSMTIKLGVAPCHQWLPHVMSSIPWMLCLILATWQKVAPMIMLMLVTPHELSYIIMMMAALSAIVGGVGGLNQAQLRTLLAYSSIGHMGWMLATMECSPNLFFMYFLTYIIISMGLMCLLNKITAINSRLSNSLLNLSPLLFTMLMLIMFSLGGLPPFIGFIPKWLVISDLSTIKLTPLMASLITGSLLNLFYYFSMTFNFILFKNQLTMSFNSPVWIPLITASCTISSLLVILM